MIGAIVFSRDRACQLDLLLRSLHAYAADLEPVQVIYHATTAEHERGYWHISDEHPKVQLLPSDNGVVEYTREALLEATPPYAMDMACFLTDDSVFYRQVTVPRVLDTAVLCHSLRLGLNTTWCYPHDRTQQLPDLADNEGQISWQWVGADGDFGYPGSLDGHVFRGTHLRRMLRLAPDSANPNQLEDHFNRWCRTQLAVEYPLMTAASTSSLVGIPVNRVNETHPNRNGERFSSSPQTLLQRYLNGERLTLPTALDVRGAHQELPLVFA